MTLGPPVSQTFGSEIVNVAVVAPFDGSLLSFGLNEIWRLESDVELVKLTVWSKEAWLPIVMVDVLPADPALTVRDDGLADSVKSLLHST